MIPLPKAHHRLFEARLLLSSLAATLFSVFLLFLLFTPKWETNDDVGMSMIAHGYGAVVAGSPNLIASNVLWGYLVRFIPEINGVLGYSIATLGIFVFVGTALLYGLCRLGLGYVASLSAFALILIRPVLFPQFTINAGLLMVGAIVCWHLFAKQGDKRVLTVGCLLAFCSYLVRDEEFFLVLIVALPLLPWRSLLLSKASKISVLALVSAMAVSAIIDHQAYQGDEWKAFRELNPVRIPFTDYNAGELLKQRPEILEKYGYSPNDINLISHWFFVDPNIANPEKLKAMLAELRPLSIRENALANAWIGVQALWHPVLLTSILAALLLAVFRPSWRVAASWGLCVAAVFGLGFLGRPGVLRVYVPLVCLLLIAPLLRGRFSMWRNRLTAGILFVAALFNAYAVSSEAETTQTATRQVRKIVEEHMRQGLISFPDCPVIVWGAAFPYESIYPVLGASSAAMSYHFYSLGVSTLAPFSVASAEQKAGRSIMTLQALEKGVPIITGPGDMQLFQIYYKEHLHGRLKGLTNQ